MDWIKCAEKMPPHMKEIKVFIESPGYEGYERSENAVWLSFTGDFFDAQEQETLHYVTKWKHI